MPTNQRSSQMREFAESKGLMTNARCLTEGVDLPAIDCVVFTDPKKSKVDIVQAAGRALRLSPGKKFGYILIPLIIPENENATEAAKDTAFEEIVATIRALATQDSRIIEYLRAVSSGSIPKGGSPVDGITKINVLTKVNEEEFNKSIQLKVWDRVAFGNWRPYEEAKKYVQSLKIASEREWRKIVSLKKLPRDIPGDPRRIYKNNFESMGIFLGTNIISKSLRVYKSFNEAKEYALKLNLKSLREWVDHARSKNCPKDIPININLIYKKKFKGWKDFLGYEDLTYEEAKKYAQSLNLKSQNEWIIHTKSKTFPKTILKKPNNYSEFEGFGEFLGTGNIAPNLRKYRSFIQAKKYAHLFRFKNVKQWFEHTKSKKFPKDIPAAVNKTYKKHWVSWGDFLGTKFIATNKRKYRSFKEIKKYVQRFNFKTLKEWNNLTKSKSFPKDITSIPWRTFKNEWRGSGDFLGTDRKPRSRKS